MSEFSSNDPFRPLLSLADQKHLDLATKLTEKKISHAPSEQLQPDGGRKARRNRLRRGGAEGAGLLDIAESSIYQGNTRLFDFFHGRTTDPQDLQRIGDQVAGVTPEDRQRLVTNQQQEVTQSLADGQYLDALIGGVKAAPGTLADSANILTDIAGGAVATTLTGGAAAPLIAGQKLKRGKDALENVGKAIDSAKKQRTRAQAVKETVKALPKTAGHMSVATADITQGQIAEYTQEFGERPSAERIAQMYGINMITMTAEGGIIKSFFIPDFKKEIKNEALAVFKNIGSGNLAHVGRRLGDGMKKVAKAGGAEAVQEYVQTWAEIINTSIGENESFVEGLKRELSSADNRLQALAGSFLGFGAGGVARAAVAAPAVAVGTAVDTVKGTAATVAKGTARAGGRIAGELSYKVLSEEERQVIREKYESEKVVHEEFAKSLNSQIDSIKKANSMAEIRDISNGISNAANEIQSSLNLTDEDLTGKNLFRVKDALIRAAKADIATSKFALETKPAATVAAKSAKNIGIKAQTAAVEIVRDIAPKAEEIIKDITDLSKAGIKAVKEVRSSTALGIMELAKNAGTEQLKTIKTAADTLNLDDLRRTRAVVSEYSPKAGEILDAAVRTKEKYLEKAGGLQKSIINSETIDPKAKILAGKPSLQPAEVASANSMLNIQSSGKITDMEALETLEQMSRLIKNSEAYKNKTKGAPSAQTMKVLDTRLERARKRLEREAADKDKSAGTKTGEAVKKAAEKVADVAKPATKAAKPVLDFIKKKATAVKERLESGQHQAALDKAYKDGIYDEKTIKAMQDFEKVAIATAGDAKKTAKAAEIVPQQIAVLKGIGVTTRADFEVFLEIFPGIQENIELIKEFEKDPDFGSDMIVDEVFDSVRGFLLDLPDQIKDAFNALNIDKGCNV
jgi:hypothetical protein